MNIRFRTLIALALIAVAGSGGVVKPTLSIERAPSSALQFNAAPAAPELQFADFYDRTPRRLNPDLQFADFYDAVEPDLQFALQFENKPGRLNPDLQFADFYDAAEPDLQFALQFENKPGRLNPDLQFS